MRELAGGFGLMCVVSWTFAFRVHLDPFRVCVEGLNNCA